MKTIFRRIIASIQFLLLAICIISCDLIEYHPYDLESKNQLSNLNQKNINILKENDDNQDTVRFIFFCDTQRHYDETEYFVKAVNNRNDIDFVLHGGDITDFGMSKEYFWVHDIMKHLNVPYVALIGNHDILGHGKDVYKKVYGDFNFSFQFRKTRFICLNTNALEFDYYTPVPDFDFMMRFMNDSTNIKRTIVVMHSPPFDDQFNNNSAIMFNEIIENYWNVKFCLHAHLHSQSAKDYFNNGIIYYGCEDVSNRNCFVFTLVGNTYSYEMMKF